MKLLERIAAVGARLHLAPATVFCYQRWVREFLVFHRREGEWIYPAALAAPEVEAFLTALARERRLSASSQNQALNALVFLYKQVLAEEVAADHLGRFCAERARRPVRLPTVLSQGECVAMIEAIRAGSMQRLMVELLYGTGLRVMECCTLRVRDVDFDRGQIMVRDTKSRRDRMVMLPGALAG